jgi:hypothetical protein
MSSAKRVKKKTTKRTKKSTIKPAVKGGKKKATKETREERRKRLKKAGYTELEIPKGSRYKSKRNLRERSREESVKLIAKRDGITVKEAKKKFKRSLVEVVWTGSVRQAYRKFLEVSPGQWLEVKKGKPMKSENTFGRVRRSPYIQRIQSMYKYWSTINLLAEAWDITPQQARKYYGKVIKKYGKTEGEELIYIDLGLYEGLSDCERGRERVVR